MCSPDDYRVEFCDAGGLIRPDLTLGANVAGAVPLRANSAGARPGIKPERVVEMLETLVALGHARRLPDGRFLP